MNKRIKELLNIFVKNLQPIKKDIYSLIIHGSSVYSDNIKKHQDIDTLVVFKKPKYESLEKFRTILNKFCKEMSNKEEEVYYSIAGSGRASLEKFRNEEKQIFRIEIFVADEAKTKLAWRANKMFPKSLAKTCEVIMGENLPGYSKYSGLTENPLSFINHLDAIQWVYCSILESGFDDRMIIASCQESVYSNIRRCFQVFGVNEQRKDRIFDEFKKLFPNDNKRFRKLFSETQKLREGKKVSLDSTQFLESVKKLGMFTRRKINERISQI